MLSRVPAANETSRLAPGRRDPVSNPVRQFFVLDFAGREVLEHNGEFGVLSFEHVAVVVEEGFHDDQRRPLVPVDERMVARQSVGVAGGQIGDLRFPVGSPILRACKRALQQAGVTDALAAAFGLTSMMTPARVSRALRRRCMTLRAMTIWRSKSSSAASISIRPGLALMTTSSPWAKPLSASSSRAMTTPVELPTLMSLACLFIRV